MLLSSLNDIRCAARLQNGNCHGSLSIIKNPVSPAYSSPHDAELEEGLLLCEECGDIYPVVCGLAILMDTCWHYLHERSDHIAVLAAGCDTAISTSMRAYIREKAQPPPSSTLLSDAQAREREKEPATTITTIVPLPSSSQETIL